MTQEELQHFFTYDAMSGNLIWNQQPDKPKDWNGRMAGRALGGKSTGSHGGKTVFKSGQVNGKSFKVMRLVWSYHHGEMPAGKVLSPADGDGMNTRIQNIQLTDRSTAQSARSSVSKTGYKGVSKHKNGYKAEITLQGTRLYLGFFSTAEEAAEMYDFAAFQANESAKLNETISRAIF
tara:strand:- start:150 stop:683 length:534 start_codon:yes stop_codon:yes gene_type:complete